MRQFLYLLLCLPLWLFAEHPAAFSSMGEHFENERDALKALAGISGFDKTVIDGYENDMQICFETGYILDEAVRTAKPDTQVLRTGYLSCLRSLQKRSERWQYRYVQSLRRAIDMNDRSRFIRLVSYPLASFARPSVKAKALAYYERFRGEEAVAAMEAIREEMRIEERSAAFLSTERSAFEKDNEVLAAEAAAADKRAVSVVTKRQGNRFLFYATNRNAYAVTVTLDLPKLRNFKPSKKLPLVFELSPNMTEQVLTVSVVNHRKQAAFASRYSWVMGRYTAVHSDPVYRLPFAIGSRVRVSQGFNGNVTHKGLTRYAVDFQCPVGTKVYAARAGRVIAAESTHDKGGFDKKFGSEANYIIIAHDDGTLGKYYHLKRRGVVVRVGERVYRGQLIGYSGNTGYSSGPHLHFSVSSVDSATKYLPTTLPFRIKTSHGIVDSIETGDVYSVVGVR